MTDLSAEFKALAAYRPTHKVRFVTAASLFDGHDAAINIMRRILQGMGAEVIHLGGQAMDKAADRRARLLIEGNLHFYREHHPLWKEASLRAVLLGTAAVRIGAILGMAAGERVGHPPSDWLWQFATRESVRTTNATMLRQWAQILADCACAGGGR